MLHRVARLVSDAARVGAVVVAVLLGFAGNVEGAIRLAGVAVILVVVRRARLVPTTDAAFSVGLVAAAWASTAHWYRRVWWIDDVMHLVVPAAAATALLQVLIKRHLLPSLGSMRPVAVSLLVVGCGMTIAVVWELYEWVAESVLGARLLVGYDDTIGDLTAALVGSTVAGVLLAMRLQGRRGG